MYIWKDPFFPFYFYKAIEKENIKYGFASAVRQLNLTQAASVIMFQSISRWVSFPQTDLVDPVWQVLYICSIS